VTVISYMHSMLNVLVLCVSSRPVSVFV